MTDDARPLPACPVCGRPAAAETPPFCSKRCRMVDLGRWFGEVYVVSSPLPGAPGDPEDEPGDER